MGITLDLRSAQPDAIHVGRSPLAELMSILHILAEPDHHPEARGWTRRLHSVLDTALANEMSTLSPLWARLRCRLLFPLKPPLDQSFDTELSLLEKLPQEEFVALCAAGILGFHEAVPAPGTLLGDRGAARDFVAQCERRAFRRGALAHELVTAPDELRTRLVDFLHGCHGAFFESLWEAVYERTQPSVVRLRAELRQREPTEVLAQLSPTAVVSKDMARVRFDKLMIAEIRIGPRPLFLIPSVHGWPHLTVKDEAGYPVIVQFAALGDRASEQISLRQLHERLTALASPSRMELCRHLLGEPITTSELARRLGMAESQVSRSLRQLRDAGLIESVRDGKYVYHRLATGTLLRLGQDVLATIMR
ncbi:DUF5937 family protein [Streptomyces scopuliridis]|uniref:Aromatic ring-opening dioxygenase LigA n=1 Tax=Streptomyces scopuliridis RB72 TaxID=1440053 RepID=A0A2T7TB63_9ACTN|nr:DUF5937 family protein [Streptomyces scopuliridis]PVE12393.1 aromatic ring-opening dioxygenase LigA [Streptomyces scopuliridis RB72]WSB37555.1 DUF5937 family protein [Streptomyces scopuliridis]